MYARCKPAQEASEEYVNACQHHFNNLGTQYCICHSVDSQGPVGSRAERSQAMSNSPIVCYLNGKLRESQKLIMFVGTKFEATVNGCVKFPIGIQLEENFRSNNLQLCWECRILIQGMVT
jgi:hypothetical protein